MTTLILFLAAFAGGALNSLAGGGTLITFPALLFAGLNPIDANASSVVALFPGTFAGAWAYRRSILAITEFSLRGFIVLSLIGGLLGALLLLYTPPTVFSALVPWLILFATLIFAAGNFAPLEVIRRMQAGPRAALFWLFIIAGVVRWQETAPMLIGSIAGSYMAAHWAMRFDQRLIKGFVIALGAVLTAYFFWRVYLRG